MASSRGKEIDIWIVWGGRPLEHRTTLAGSSSNPGADGAPKRLPPQSSEELQTRRRRPFKRRRFGQNCYGSRFSQGRIEKNRNHPDSGSSMCSTKGRGRVQVETDFTRHGENGPWNWWWCWLYFFVTFHYFSMHTIVFEGEKNRSG